MMKYGVRVALGVVVGLAFALGLTLWLGRWWVGALAGGLLGPVAFLATFFIWSADRPDEGYEQVLFDRPNTVLGGVMMVAFVGLAFGSGWLLSGPAGPTPEEAAALAQMDETHANLTRLAKEYGVAAEAVTKNGDPGDLDADLAQARDARVDLQAMEVPESLAERKAALEKGAKALEGAFAALARCAQGEAPACLDARIGYADATRGLQLYEEPQPAE